VKSVRRETQFLAVHLISMAITRGGSYLLHSDLNANWESCMVGSSLPHRLRLMVKTLA